MKTLDVQSLHNAIDQTLEQLKHQSYEFALRLLLLPSLYGDLGKSLYSD